MNDNSDSATRTATRQRLVEAAGEMFAARGFEGATAKEICARAGVHPAAVNYHFGGLEGLYEAVLVEARERAAAHGDQIQAVLKGPTPFDERLRTMIALVVKGVLSPSVSSWVLRLFIREITNPSVIGRRILATTIAPRVARARAVVAEFLGMSSDDPRVALACISISAPLQILLIGDRELLGTIHPSLSLTADSEEALTAFFQRSAMAILMALQAEASREGQ